MPTSFVNRRIYPEPEYPRAMGKSTQRISFGALVRKLRNELDMSQEDLAKKVGIKQSSLSDIETGDTSIDDVKGKTLLGLAKHLGTTTTQLSAGTELPLVDEDELLVIFRQLEPELKEALLLQCRAVLKTQKTAKGARPEPQRKDF